MCRSEMTTSAASSSAIEVTTASTTGPNAESFSAANAVKHNRRGITTLTGALGSATNSLSEAGTAYSQCNRDRDDDSNHSGGL